MTSKSTTPHPSLASLKAFCRHCRLMYDRRLVCGTGGNLAERRGDHILLTPTGRSLRALKTDQVVVSDLQGRYIAGTKPTREASMHLAILRARPEIGAVCHAHGAAVIAVASLLEPGEASLPAITPGFALCAHPLPLLPYFTPGTDELATAVGAVFAGNRRRAVLLQNHGLVTAGRDFDEAFDIAEEVEEAAHAYLLASGKARTLTAEDLAPLS